MSILGNPEDTTKLGSIARPLAYTHQNGKRDTQAPANELSRVVKPGSDRFHHLDNGEQKITTAAALPVRAEPNEHDEERYY